MGFGTRLHENRLIRENSNRMTEIAMGLEVNSLQRKTEGVVAVEVTE